MIDNLFNAIQKKNLYQKQVNPPIFFGLFCLIALHTSKTQETHSSGLNASSIPPFTISIEPLLG